MVRRIDVRRVRISRDARGLEVHAQVEACLETEARDGTRRIEPTEIARDGGRGFREWEKRGDEWRARLGGRWAHGAGAELTIELILRQTTTFAGKRLAPATSVESEQIAEVLASDPATGATMRLTIPLAYSGASAASMDLGAAPSVRELVARAALHARGRGAPSRRVALPHVELDPTATAQLLARLARRIEVGEAPLVRIVSAGTAASARGPRVLHFPWLSGGDGPHIEGIACVALSAGGMAFVLAPFRVSGVDIERALLRDDARGGERLASRWEGVDVWAPSLRLEGIG